jgi:hypothetical protein
VGPTHIDPIQIYTSSLLFPRHTPFNRVPRRRPLQPAGSTGHVGRRCPTSGLHTLESLLLFGAHDGHAPPFLAVHGGEWGLRWLIYSWVVPVTACVLHPLSSPADSAPVSSVGSLFSFFLFFFPAFVLCIPLIFPVQYACVLLKFYWNFSWLDARSALFYLRSVR